MEFYVYASETECELPKFLDLEGTWQVALCEVIIKGSHADSFYLCADFVETSMVDAMQLPVLRKIDPTPPSTSAIYVNKHFHTVSHHYLKTLRFDIRDLEGQRISCDHLECSLHFRWAGP